MNTRILMRAAVVLAVVLAFTERAAAAPVKVDIPKEGWSIAFDSPSLSKQEESRGDGEYAFRANSGRFNISLFVEKPGGTGKTHRDCYEFYWSLAKLLRLSREVGRRAHLDHRPHEGRRGNLRGVRPQPALRLLTLPRAFATSRRGAGRSR